MNEQTNDEMPYWKRYYTANKETICKNRLNRYAFNAIKRIKEAIPEKVDEYLLKYPWNAKREKFARMIILKKNIRLNSALFSECFEASMLAYIYAIHRCAVNDCNYVDDYIKKMTRIYVICAIIAFNADKSYLARQGYKTVSLDAPEWKDRA